MRSPLISALRPPRPSTPDRRAIKQALWSLQLYASGYKAAQLPADMRPMSIDEATDIVAQGKDPHAMQRRTRVLRRFRPQLFKPGPEEWRACTDERARQKRDARWRTECAERLAKARRSRAASNRAVQQLVEACAAEDKLPPCVPTADDPNYDPVRGTTRLYSTLTVRRSMGLDLAQLLDPRAWDECSDLFEETYEVEPDGNGGYREKPTPPEAYGCGWQGLLYEFADAGPQAVQNVLWVRFAVTRACEPIPYYLDPERKNPSQWDRENRRRRDKRNFRDFKWRSGRNKHYRQECSARMDALPSRQSGGRDCGCPLDAVEIHYELHDSLSYRVGPLTLPGMMRQNSGYLRAWSRRDCYTDIECVKNIRFGRLSRWSNSGAFDFGEMLNYTAAAFLSLWIGEIEQIVPCCEQRKAKRSS